MAMMREPKKRPLSFLCLLALRHICLKNICAPPSQLCDYRYDPFIKCFRRLFPLVSAKLMEQPPVLDEKDAGTIACRIGVMGDHHNGFVFLFVHGGKHIHEDLGVFAV